MSDRACRLCGCTQEDACFDEAFGPCFWVGDDLCSQCARQRCDCRAAEMIGPYRVHLPTCALFREAR